MEIKTIPLSLVTPSPMNPRKTFDQETIGELADNIETQGLLQPVTVRPIADRMKFADPARDYYPEYEIVCGERRYRAFVELKDKWQLLTEVSPAPERCDRFTEIPAIVREMTDEEAFEAMITENLQRHDVDPMEEAFAFGQLIQHGCTPEEVAARIGKSVRFVQDRVKLNNLIPELALAVKDGLMSISAALLISKLEDDDQRRYCTSYSPGGKVYTKETVTSYITHLFMQLDSSIWHKNGEADFSGGCSRCCADCECNTLNHGCLFWEMKATDGGRCTNRDRFRQKTIAYMLDRIDRHSAQLVRKGEPLVKGKTVLMHLPRYTIPEMDRLAERLLPALENRGYEIVDPEETFHHRCHYNSDDPRVAEMLESGEIYRGIQLFNWTAPALSITYFYVKKEDTSVNCSEDGVPRDVALLLKDMEGSESSLQSALTAAKGEARAECGPSSGDLRDTEAALLLTCMLEHNIALARKWIPETSVRSFDPAEMHSYISAHPEIWNSILRAWMYRYMSESNRILHLAEPELDAWTARECPDIAAAQTEKRRAKYRKIRANAERRLKALGYGPDGKPLA